MANRPLTRLVLLVVALVLLAVFALGSSGWVTETRPMAFLGWGLVALAASFLS